MFPAKWVLSTKIIVLRAISLHSEPKYVSEFGIPINYTAQKLKVSIKDIFSKCDQIHRFGHIYWRNPWWKTSFFVLAAALKLQENKSDNNPISN